PEPLASPSAFVLASPSAARRPLSKSDAWSCHPAEAAVMDAMRAAVAVSALSVLFRIGLGSFGRFAVLRCGPALEIGGRRHADHVKSGVDEVNLTRDASRQVAKQVQCRAADMVEFDRFLERRMAFVPFEHHPGVANGAAGQGAHRAGADRINPDRVL